MNKAVGIIIALVVAALAVGGIVALVKNNTNKSVTTTPTSQTSGQSSASQTGSSPSSQADQSAPNTITYTSTGFAPTMLSIKAGTTVTFKNNSSEVIQVDSDPHPVHTDEPELNIGTINPGQTGSATITRKGTWGYHNHLNSIMTGKIDVQ